MCACREGHEEIVQFLISYGVEVTMSTKVLELLNDCICPVIID